MSHNLKEICGNCGKTYGAHHGGTSPWPRDYCPGNEDRMDWENGPGTVFKLINMYGDRKIMIPFIHPEGKLHLMVVTDVLDITDTKDPLTGEVFRILREMDIKLSWEQLEVIVHEGHSYIYKKFPWEESKDAKE